MQQFFLARQPILDRNGNLCAFELLFRSGASAAGADVADDTLATAQVMLNAFGGMGIANVLGAYKGFINLDAKFLYSGSNCCPGSKWCWNCWKPSSSTKRSSRVAMN